MNCIGQRLTRITSRTCFSTQSNGSASAPQGTPTACIGWILKRDPLLLPTPSALETSYLNHKTTSFNQTQARGFVHPFYFKPGTMVEEGWKAMGIPPRNVRQWTSNEEWALHPVAPRQFLPQEEVVMTSESEAIRVDKGAAKSLDRKMEEVLYFVHRSAGWRLPGQLAMKEGEALHEAAQRSVKEMLGGEVETWVVGQVPVGHRVAENNSDATYFMRIHLLSGDVAAKKDGEDRNLDYGWFTKDECALIMDPAYYESVKDML